MYKINFEDKSQHIHFIGIGGISMSGLAELLIKKGFSVSGSDSKQSELTDRLSGLGAQISYPQSQDNITDDIDVVIMTAAIREDNPELMEVKRRGISLMTRAELLGQVMTQYSIPTAVSGTHGKTTTTSMLSELLINANLDPTLSIGGILPSIGGNFRIGGSEHFVTEACEYTNSFLSFFPKVEIILNVDADHLDFFKDIDDIRHSFARFANLLPDDGALIINGDIDGLDEITSQTNCTVITFGLDGEYDYSATDITFDEFARPTFTLLKSGERKGSYSLGVTGIHNVCNALSVIAFGELFDIADSIIKESLLGYTGTDRRFQLKGQFNGVNVLDDYAHHPTEISATLSAAKNYPHNTLWCVFQPHTYTRTKALMSEFALALSAADNIILAEIYPARETDNLGISSQTLAEEIKKYNKNVWCISTFSEIENFAQKNCFPNDLLITMGAGDVVKIGENLIK